jgi:transcription antitermination factor NusG
MNNLLTGSWYALRIKSRHEKIVASALFGKGYEVFLPLYRDRRRWSDRMKELELPLFPGYLFCRFDVMKRLPILTTPGIVQLVGVGKTPLPVDDAEITAIQSIVISRLNAQPWPYLQVGQRVRIEQGPLTGLEGILIALKKTHRLVVSVTLLQRSVAVEVDHDWARPVAPEQPGRGKVVAPALTPALGFARDDDKVGSLKPATFYRTS